MMTMALVPIETECYYYLPMAQVLRNGYVTLLLVVTLLVTVGTIFADFRFDNAIAGARASAWSLDRDFGSIDVGIADFRGAQASYVATAQGADFWTRRAGDLADQLTSTLGRLRAGSTTAAAKPHYDAAASALEDLTGIDKKARTLLAGDQRLLASDLVFVDALEATQRLTSELAEARARELSASDLALAQSRRVRLGVNAGALGLLLLAAVLVSRGQREPAPSPAASTAQMIRDLPPPVKVTIATTAAPAARILPSPPPSPPPPPPVVSLPDAAELCVDLARVIDGRDMPALLERAAGVLDAKGVIVWVADTVSQRLRPSLTHGYPDKVLSRLGTLDIEADNVTSLSFRSMRPQTMNSTEPGRSGAVAVPLVTSSGCTGVLSAETHEGTPTPELIAMAKIIAAQLATLISPDDTVAAHAAEA